jgi:hypothetical protein
LYSIASVSLRAKLAIQKQPEHNTLWRNHVVKVRIQEAISTKNNIVYKMHVTKVLSVSSRFFIVFQFYNHLNLFFIAPKIHSTSIRTEAIRVAISLRNQALPSKVSTIANWIEATKVFQTAVGRINCPCSTAQPVAVVRLEIENGSIELYN